MRRLVALLPLLFCSWCGLEPAFAQTVPGEPSHQVVRFPDGATTVVVDVYDLVSGSQLANDVSATRIQLDAANTDAWTVNVAGVAGYPTTCDPKTFVLRWQPDATNCSSSPGSCIVTRLEVGGAACLRDARRLVSEVYARDVVTAQGISRAVLKAYNRIGKDPVRWRRIDIAADEDFSGPSETYWEVYFYSNEGQYPHDTCMVVTTTDPASAIPSDASCAGN